MNEHIYEIIAKTLNGEGSPKEQQQLNDWLQADPANKIEYEEMKMLWHESDAVFATSFDTNVAWEKVAGKVGIQQEVKQQPRRVIAFPAWKRYSMAAAAVLLMGIIIGRSLWAGDMIEVVASTNMEVVLPDDSHVALSKGSMLKYPKHFAANERHVELEGEAFFEVTRNEQQPFTIDAQSVNVKVLGTSFNVNCNEKRAYVVVATGKVQVAKDKSKVVLTKGQEATYVSGKLEASEQASGNYLYWKTGELVYTNVPFADVIQDLNKILNINITFEAAVPAEVKGQLVNTRFKDKTIGEILSELCEITGCSYTKTSNDYVIRSK